MYDALLDAFLANKKAGGSREDFLMKAAKIEGIYVPSFYNVTYKEDGTIAEFLPNKEGIPSVIEKQIVMDLPHAPYPKAPVVPFLSNLPRFFHAADGTAYRPGRNGIHGYTLFESP